MPPREVSGEGGIRNATSCTHVERLAEDFLADRAATVTQADSTQRRYEKLVREFAAGREELPGDGELRRLFVKRCEESAPSTVRQWLSLLRGFFEHLVAINEIDGNPMKDFRVQLTKTIPTVLSPAQILAMLGHWRGRDALRRRNQLLIALLWDTGCRISELVGLDLDGVFLTDRSLRVMGKGAKERLVLFTRPTQQMLATYLRTWRARLLKTPTPALLLTRTGRRLERIRAYQVVRDTAEATGCPGIRPHTLRHSFATHMVKGLAQLHEIQALLGHESISSTQLYTHVDDSHKRAVHQRFHPRG